MGTVFWGTLVFASGLAVHAAWWRIRLPRRQALALARIMSGSLAAFVAAAPLLPESALPGGFAELAHIILYAVSLQCAYLVTYSAIEVDSPSLLIIEKIEAAGSGGLEREVLARELGDDVLLLPRLEDLVVDRMAHVSGGRYLLTGKGRALAFVFKIWREIIGRGKGG